MVMVGDLPIEIAWTFEGKPLSQFMGFSVSTVGRSSLLQIETVEPNHGGRYACVAKNPSGNDAHEATLQVHG